MYLMGGEERRKLFKGLVAKARHMDVGEDFRGWSWDRPPMEPPYDLKIPLYEVAGKYCSTGRDVYLKHVEKARPIPSKDLVRGSVYHRTVAEVLSVAKVEIYKTGYDAALKLSGYLAERVDPYLDEVFKDQAESIKLAGFSESELEEVRENVKKIWFYETGQMTAAIHGILSKQPRIGVDALVHSAIPVVVEQKLDGSCLGLSGHLSADAFSFEAIILDLKTGVERDFHKLTTTGYGLVYESIFEYPINIGCIVYVGFWKGLPVPKIERVPHLLDEPTRQDFLDERDKKLRIIAEKEDPGRPRDCFPDCQYWHICHDETKNILMM